MAKLPPEGMSHDAWRLYSPQEQRDIIDERTKQVFEEKLAQKAEDKEAFHQAVMEAFGDTVDPSVVENIRQQALAKDSGLRPTIEYVDSAQLEGAEGAYNAEDNIVYISEEYVGTEKAGDIYTEEASHALDIRFNTRDAQGDEGAMFHMALDGIDSSSQAFIDARTEDDRGVIYIDGERVAVEFKDDSEINAVTPQDIANNIIANIEIAENNSSPTLQEKEEQRKAILLATQDLERLSNIEDVDLRQELLEEIPIERLGEIISSFDGVDNSDDLAATKEAVSNLTRATESLGIEDAHLITAPLARGLQPNPFLRQRIAESIEAGDGAIFATSLSASPDLGRVLKAQVGEGTVEGLQLLDSAFDIAHQEKQKLDQQVAQYVAEFNGVFTPEKLEAGIAAIMEKNKSVIDNYNDAAGALGTALDAVIVQPNEIATAPNDPQGAIVNVSNSIKDKFPDIAESEVGLELIADAIVESGNNDDVINFFTEISKSKGTGDKVANAVFKAVSARASLLIREGDFDGTAQLFKGFEKAEPLLGVSDSAKLQELTDLVANQGNPSKALSADEFATQFSEKSNSISGTAGANGDSIIGESFKVLGVVVGAAALSQNALTFPDDDIEKQLKTLVDSAGLAGDLAGVIPKGRAADALGNIGRLAKAGVIFEAINTVRVIQKGDVPEAGLAITGLVGTILTTSSFGGPIGTAIGAALSAIAVVGSIGLSIYRTHQDEKRAEGDLQAFLQGAGLNAEDAKLLRDLNGKHQSIGLIFTQIADRHPELEPYDVMKLLLDPGEYGTGKFGGIPLSDDGRPLIDRRSQVIDQIEALERDENGNFTDQAVEEAMIIFERNLGVSIEPEGFTSTTALAAFSKYFDAFDSNNDGVVSHEELNKYAIWESDNESTPTAEQEEMRKLARYIVNRDDFFERLDNQGEVPINGIKDDFGDEDISRQDINVVSEQNQALQVLYANRKTFDTAKHGAGSRTDGQISKNDLKAIRDGDYPAELKEAAEYLLENKGFYRLVDTAEERASGKFHELMGPTGDGEISLSELSAAMLDLNAADLS